MHWFEHFFPSFSRWLSETRSKDRPLGLPVSNRRAPAGCPRRCSSSILSSAPTVPEWVAAYYGAARTRAVLNPLSSMLTTDKLRYTVAGAGARVVAGASDKLGRLLSGRPCCPLGRNGAGPSRHAARLARAGRRSLRRPRALSRGPGGDRLFLRHDRAAQGAMQSHRAVVAAHTGTAMMAGRTAEDRVINALPDSAIIAPINAFLESSNPRSAGRTRSCYAGGWRSRR